MTTRLLQTPNDRLLTIGRVILGIVYFAHGAQKLLGWFGGSGYSASLSMFHGLGIPAFFGFLSIVAEFFGGIALILGLLGRVAAFAIAVDMIVALLVVHLPNGLFMNWTGQKAGEGFEYHLITIALAGFIMVRGSGAFSLDRVLSHGMVRGPSGEPHPEPMHG